MKLNPYIRFEGQAKEAMEFYKDVFGGDLNVMKLGDSPMAKDMPADSHDKVMHSQLEKNGKVLIQGSDMMMDPLHVGDNVSISVECESEQELRDIFAKLSVGGEVFQDIQVPFWGGLFADVIDKYKIEWMLTFGSMNSK